jgi:hypothetical protein
MGKQAKGTLIIVLDDAGYSMEQLKPFLALPFPLTVAVLPGLPHTREAARASLSAGKELILHQPMEPLGKEDPGPGAIMDAMDPHEAQALLAANLASLPRGFRGVNNHMGSKATENAEIMRALLDYCAENGLYFLDSRTSPASAVSSVSREAGIRAWERSVFIDNVQERSSFISQIREGLKKAEKNGYAVMIGHVWSSELAQTLLDLYPELIAEGYSFSTISALATGRYNEEDDAP